MGYYGEANVEQDLLDNFLTLAEEFDEFSEYEQYEDGSHNHGFPSGDQDQSNIMERASTSMPNIKNEPIEEDNVDRTGSEEQIESFDASQHHITIGSYSNSG